MLIGIGIVMIIITAAVVVVLRKRMGEEEDLPKDFSAGGMPPGMPNMSAQPTTAMPDMNAQPAQSYAPVAVEPVAAMPDMNAQPVAAVEEPTVANQWTDETGHTWRVMSDGTNRWWNGTDWQKV